LSEADIVRKTPFPATTDSLTVDLRTLGLFNGMTLLVHSSLSALGWVCGGAVAVIGAFEAAIGKAGTLVMPSFTGDNSDPAYWRNPPVPESWWQTIRDQLPAFDPDLTPSRNVGAIAEAFRKQPGTSRSGHPQVSFSARGPQSAQIVSSHPLDYALGDRGPLGRLYDSGAYILLFGVGYHNNTSLHLAEYRAAFPGKRIIRSGASVMEDGRRVWKIIEDFDDDSTDFERLGADFEAACPNSVRIGKVGLAEVRLISCRSLVDYAVNWMNHNRK
jgi:aminoglycoside 3-N-acetyltransferase